MAQQNQDQPSNPGGDAAGLTRRELLQHVGMLAVVAFAPLGCSDSSGSRATVTAGVPVGNGQARYLSDTEMETLRALMDTFLPPDGTPGGAEGGCADAIDALLAAFAVNPPRIYAGGPFSDRAGSPVNHFAQFLPLDAYEARAWQLRIEGSKGEAGDEFNGPIQGLQSLYRDGLAALDAAAAQYGSSFAALPLPLRELVIRNGGPQVQALVDTSFPHALQFMYGAPEYGGNRDLAGWRFTKYDGDVQPRGYTAEEISERGPQGGLFPSLPIPNPLALLGANWLAVAPLMANPEAAQILATRSGGSMSALASEVRAAASVAKEKPRG